MSHIKTLLLLTPLLLFSVEPPVVDIPALHHQYPSEELPKKSFTYLNAGVTTWVPMMFETEVRTGAIGTPLMGSREVTTSDRLSFIMPDLSLGARSLSTHNVFDRVIGIAVQSKTQLIYIQGSYLFYPTPSKHIYFGAGLTCGLCYTEDIPSTFIYVNLPITLGYQFPSKNSFQFLQIQATPLQTGTISYGIGF